MSQQMVDLNIVNGQVVTSSGIHCYGISVQAGKIVALGEPERLPPAKRTIDVKGKYVLPGLVDPEAHPGCYVPFAYDLRTESRAAGAAGVTTWGIHAPSTRMGAEPFKPQVEPGDVVSFTKVWDSAMKAVRENSMVDVFFTFMLETDEQANEIPIYAKEMGVTSFKLYLHCKRPELDKYWSRGRAGLITGFDDGTVYLTMEKTAEIGQPGIVAIHAENWEIARIFEQRLIAEGRTDWAAWTDRSPDFVEAHHVRAYAYLAKITGCPLYIQHATTERTYEEILRARGEGLTIHAQTGPAWLYFSAEAGWRINVPLRYRKDIPKIWDAVAKGIIDAVGSDHVVAWEPSGREDMYNENIWKLRTGFTSRVECLLPVMLSEGVNKGRITLEKVAEVCAENPAKIFGLYPKKGAIVVGADADFVVVDLDREVQVGKQHILTRSGWSLLEGHVMRGWPVMTILRGNVIAEWPEGEPGPRIVAESPVGRYVPRIPGRALYPLG